MGFSLMEPIVGLYQPKHRIIMSPGPQAMLGATHTQVRLKHNTPNDPIRWVYDGEQLKRNSTQISDGQYTNKSNRGGPPIVVDHNRQGHRIYMKNRGKRIQNILPDYRFMEAVPQALPDFSWNNRIATVNHSFNSGQKFFNPLPHGYYGVGLPRGGQIPRITDIVRPDPIIEDVPRPIIGIYPQTGGLKKNPNEDSVVAPRAGEHRTCSELRSASL